MKLLMDGPVRTVVNHPPVCLPGAPGGRPGGCADAEELVSAKWLVSKVCGLGVDIMVRLVISWLSD